MENTTEQKNTPILITKASGAEEHFSSDKLKRSLLNAGATHERAQRIVSDIEAWIMPGISTKKIYARAFSLLRRDRMSNAVRYKLKQAILQLGPTGYPFEILMGQLFDLQGYQTQVGIVVDGMCITHEMDVIATNDSSQHLVECKYHMDQGKQVSIQVPLYVRSRVNDIIQKRKESVEYQHISFTGWVITNTRFSPDSMHYSKCSGLKLLAWDYPMGNGLKDWLEKYKLYPITILASLTRKEKQALMDQHIVSCPQLLKNTEALNVFGFGQKKQSKIITELEAICF
jgi:hypothetical protein